MRENLERFFADVEALDREELMRVAGAALADMPAAIAADLRDATEEVLALMNERDVTEVSSEGVKRLNRVLASAPVFPDHAQDIHRVLDHPLRALVYASHLRSEHVAALSWRWKYATYRP